MVEGRLKLDQWDDKQTGQTRSRLGVVLESFTFIDSGGGQRGGAEGSGADAPRARPAASAAVTKTEGSDEAPPPDDDDVPF